MRAKLNAPQIPLPESWPGCVKSAVLHAIALAHYTGAITESIWGASVASMTYLWRLRNILGASRSVDLAWMDYDSSQLESDISRSRLGISGWFY